MVNTYAVQSGGCRFESLWGFGFYLKGAHYEVDYSGKKTYLAGLQCTLTSSCAKRGTLLDLSVAKSVSKNSKGGPLGTLKNFRKKVAVPKKIQKGPLGTSGFVGFLEKVKNERGTLWTKFALTGLGLRWFQEFSKKWTDQCEVCGLKKNVTLVGHFSLKGKRAD